MVRMGRFALLALVCGCSYTAASISDDQPSPDSPAIEPDGPPSDSAVSPPDSPLSSEDGPATPTTTEHVTDADTWIQVNFATTNNGAAGFVIADGNPLCVALLRFDLSGLAGSTVNEAELHVFTNFDLGAQVEVFAINEAWSESQATWNQRANGQAWMAAGASPPSRGSTAIATFTPGQPDTEFPSTLDVATVQGWIDNSGSNFGLAIASVNTDGPKFLSRESANFKPFLRIKHTP